MASTTGAAATASPLPAVAPGRRTTAPTSSRRNGAVVRQLIGDDRFVSHAAYRQLRCVYELARLHVNFFQPVEKLLTKTRQGARTHRVYDRAQTPYQRLRAAGVLTAEKSAELERLYQSLHPLRLRRDLEAALDQLGTLAAPDPRRPLGDTELATPSRTSSPGGAEPLPPVTLSFESTRTGG